MTAGSGGSGGPRVLLLGMMGSGKSSVGRALAERTGWPYLDNDELLRRACGMSTPEVLRRGGEPALRDAESAALGEALAADPPVVAGVAAGVVTRAADRARLRAAPATVVWLRARLETLLARVGSGEGRPWLQPDPETALRRLAEGRDPLYTEVADVVVDVDELTPEQIADRLLPALAPHPRPSL